MMQLVRKNSIWIAILLACICAATPVFLPAQSSPGKESLGDHYLLLVTSVNASTLTAEKISQFAKSEYQGLAVSFLGAYDTQSIPEASEMKKQILAWNQAARKDMWPWVYVNRMVGADPSGSNPHASEPYFARMKGADLDGSLGNRQDFLNYWRNSLRAAQQAQSPGIVVDLEFYLNYRAYDPTKLAQQAGKKPAEVIGLLRELGLRMADIAGTEYPNAAIWFLFTDLGDPKFVVVDGQPYYPSPAYIVQGLLDESQTRHFPLKVISGGEVGLGYCHTSLDQLKMKIRNRATDFDAALHKYNSNLELGGTLTLWNETSGKSDWMMEGYCGRSSAATVEDLQPFLEQILQTYRYNWIYASGNGSYYAFHPRSAPRFDDMIRNAGQSVNGGRKH